MLRILITLTFISLAVARPGFRNIFDRVLHKKAFDHAMKKRTGEGTCVSTATVVGEILENAGPLIMGGEPQGPELNILMHSIINQVAGFDVFDQEQRERVLCGLSGLSTLSELRAVTRKLGLQYMAVKNAYDFASASIIMERQVYGQILAKSDPGSEDKFIQQLATAQELFLAVETSGFLALDPEGVAFFTNILSMSSPQEPATPLSVSDAPTEAKCSKIVKAVRKAWNYYIESASEWNPNAAQEISDVIKQWTGIRIENHGAIRSMICELLESGLDGGLIGINAWLDNRFILSNLTSTGYPIVVEHVQQLKMMLEMLSSNGPPSVGGPHYNYNYPSNYPSYGPSNYPSYPSYGPSEGHIHMMGLALQALEGLEDMGLLTLTDDL